VFTQLGALKPKTTYSWQPFSSDTFRQLDTGPVGRFTTKSAPSPAAKLIVIAFRASASRRAGVGKLTWNRKLHGKRAKPGTYRLTVTATSGGKTTSSTLPVKLH
jgi:hypothetical protein